MKRILILSLFVVFITGCANPAQIKEPILADLSNDLWQQKTLSYQVNYAQPTPGIFTGGDVVELQPIRNVSKSIYSSKILSTLDDHIKTNIPNNIKFIEDSKSSDYRMEIDLIAFHKKGPAYSDYLDLANWTKFFLTLSMNYVHDYDIIADYKLNCRLYDKNDNLIHENGYKVKDVLEHEEYKYNITSSDDILASALFKKHISININNFFKELEKQSSNIANL